MRVKISPLDFGCLPTAIGSMPHHDPEEACRLVLKHLPDLPTWPQLPKRSFLENMYAQFSEGFPGLILEGEHIYVSRSGDFDQALEQLYKAYQGNNLNWGAVSSEYAAGLQAFLSLALKPRIVKGQVTGPVTFGLSITDREGLPILYDETLAEAIVKHLRLKAAWQEKTLSRISPNTIIFIDEPYLGSLGTPSVSLPSEKVVSLLEEVLGGISRLKGIHCCSNADWSLLLKTSIDILSFDTYNYADSLSLYPDEVKSLLKRGGAIAWGIVPNDEEALAKESVFSLHDRLEEAMAPFTREGVPFRQLIEQGLLTPSCGLASLSPGAAEHALELLAELSTLIRKRYRS